MTYSIVARDADTGELGVAVQSHWFAAGAEVPWAQAGVGAVATQATIEVAHGPRGLALLARGVAAREALEEVLAADPQAEHRQVAIVDAFGRASAHTGRSCIPEAGHRLGPGFSVQANMMSGDTVWDAMHEAFSTATGPLAVRMLASLDAAEREGGDIRGRQAAGMRVVAARGTERPWEDVIVDLRIDDHPDPLVELRRLLGLKLAYDHLERAEELSLDGDDDGAVAEAASALRMAPGNPEITFWTAVGMASAGHVEAAADMLEPVFDAHAGWRELLRRLLAAGLVELPPDAGRRLLRG